MSPPGDGAETLARLRRGDLAGAHTLNLANADLVTLPDEVLGLADTLEVLDIGGNAITTLPHGIGRLRKLRVLFGSRNPVRHLPEALGDCASLTQIGFRGCRLESVPDASIPPGLRWLTLTDNRIGALPASLGDRAALRKLLLSGNRLRTLPSTFEGAASLELLRIAANRFEELPPFLGHLSRLAWLGFAGNPAEGGASAAARPVAETRSLAIGARLGEGASGIVHATSWRHDGRTEEVALKLFNGTLSSDGLVSREIDAALATGRHPDLLGGLAFVPDHPSGTPGLLLPRVPPTWHPLAAPPSHETCSRDVYAGGLRFPRDVPGRIARAVASAGAHLASCGMLHGDLYGHNILWDGTSGAARLGDLGAASRLPSGPAAETIRRTDILAWGILANELLARADAPDEPLRAAASRASHPQPALRPASFDEILRSLPPVPAHRH